MVLTGKAYLSVTRLLFVHIQPASLRITKKQFKYSCILDFYSIMYLILSAYIDSEYSTTPAKGSNYAQFIQL